MYTAIASCIEALFGPSPPSYNNIPPISQFADTKAVNVSIPEELAGKIRELTAQLAHEQVSRGTRVTLLREFTHNKSHACLKETHATRLLQSIRRNDTMISVYESSLSALEEMQSNLQAQRVSGTTTQMLKRMARGDTREINLDEVDISLEHLEELKLQRQQLAGMMAVATEENPVDDGTFINSLGLAFAQDPEFDGSALIDGLSEPPVGLLSMSDARELVSSAEPAVAPHCV